MADFIDLVCRRFSVRRYKPDPVPEESLQKVLEAGRHAPSACNFQPWHILVVRDEEKRKACYAFYPQSWFVEAPVILGVFVDTSRAWKRSDG
ncbi:MAG: nitroreductase, partial [Lentisphaerae bacterium]